MSEFDPSNDYYRILGCDESTSRRDIHRRYKRLAALHHPDRGGSETQMKSLNEAYAVLKDDTARREYDSGRRQLPEGIFTVSAPAARDVGVYGQSLSAFLCLLLGLFLLCLVKFQWIWFLWPLTVLAAFVIVFGILLAHSAMISLHRSLRPSHRMRRQALLRETVFWMVIGGFGYAVYLLLSG